MTDKINLYKQDNGLAILTFNRPQALNALDLDAMRLFASTIGKLSRMNDLRAVILTGAGDSAFCSGGDLFELSNYPSENDAQDFIKVMGNALYNLEKLPVPVIAAINGYALGGGSEIAVACDMRIVDKAVQMGFVQVRMGLTPGWGAGQRLLRLVGYPKAMELLLTGHVMHAHELNALGLVNKVAESGMALQEAIAFSERYIVANSRDVIHGIKILLRAGLEQTCDDALQIEQDLFPPLWAGEAHLKAVDEFLKRQKDRKSEG